MFDAVQRRRRRQRQARVISEIKFDFVRGTWRRESRRDVGLNVTDGRTHWHCHVDSCVFARHRRHVHGRFRHRCRVAWRGDRGRQRR